MLTYDSRREVQTLLFVESGSKGQGLGSMERSQFLQRDCTLLCLWPGKSKLIFLRRYLTRLIKLNNHIHQYRMVACGKKKSTKRETGTDSSLKYCCARYWKESIKASVSFSQGKCKWWPGLSAKAAPFVTGQQPPAGCGASSAPAGSPSPSAEHGLDSASLGDTDHKGQTAKKGGKVRGPEGAHALRGSCWGMLEAVRKKTCFQFPVFASDLRRSR